MLHNAAHKGHLEVCNVLFDFNVEIDSLTDFGCTPLHMAAHGGNLKVCQLLIENGAETYPRNNKNKTPLDFAIQNSHKEVESYLRNKRKRPSDKNILRDKNGNNN